MTIRALYTDLEWYDTESKRIVGDMGFSFCDASDTLRPIEEIDDYLKGSYDYINSEDCDEYESDDVAIYIVSAVDVEFDDEDVKEYGEDYDYANNLWLGERGNDMDIIALFICTEDAELAKKIASMYDDGMFAKIYYGDHRGK
jgi:hypothetical protein